MSTRSVEAARQYSIRTVRQDRQSSGRIMDSRGGRLGTRGLSWWITRKSCAGPGSKFMTLRDDFELANQRAKDLQRSVPRVVAAHYDRKSGRVVIQLSSKLIVSFSPGDVEGLEDAKAAQLSEIEISPSGFGIHFPAVDADLYVPGLLEGILGSKRWMAARLGQIGGQSRSRAQKSASRANGRLGGRPRKVLER